LQCIRRGRWAVHSLGRRAPFNAGVLLNATKRSFEDSGENEAGVIAEATPASKRGLRIDSII